MVKINALVGTKFAGGLGKILWQDILGIRETGHLDTIYCLEKELPEDIGVPHVVLTKFGVKNYQIKDALVDYDLAFRLTPCDAFHTLAPWSVLSNKIMKRKYGTKIVFQSPSCPLIEKHEVEYERANFNMSVPGRPTFKIGYLNEAFQTADYIITPTLTTKYQLVDVYKINENNIKVIRPGVEFPEETGETPEKFTVMSAGSVSLRKGQFYIGKACANLDVDVNLVGHKRLPDRIFPDNCNIPGYVDEIEPYFKNCSVYIQASVSDGYPNATLRAMSFGNPVIVTEGVGVKEIIEDGREGFVVPKRDPNAIREKVQYFMDNPGEVERMGENARKQVSRYSWERYHKMVRDFYQEEVLG